MLKRFFARIWDYLTTPGEILNQSRYLAQATDVSDLEHRLKTMQYAKSRFHHL